HGLTPAVVRHGRAIRYPDHRTATGWESQRGRRPASVALSGATRYDDTFAPHPSLIAGDAGIMLPADGNGSRSDAPAAHAPHAQGHGADGDGNLVSRGLNEPAAPWTQFGTPDRARLTVATLRQALRAADPAAVLVAPRVLERVIRQVGNLSAMVWTVPH